MRKKDWRTSHTCIDLLESRAYLSGTLGPVTDYPGVTAPTAVVVGDFNNDGKADLAVAGTDPNTGLPTVAIYLNNNGTFPSTPLYSDLTGSQSVLDMTITDVSASTNTDLAATDPVDATVVLLVGNGDGTFAAPVSTSYGTPQSASANPVAYIATGPFTPNFQTLIVTDPGDHQIVPLINNSNGGYTPGTPVTVSETNFAPQHIVAADFNQDGSYDIAFSDGTNPQVFVADGDGNGGFSAPTLDSVAGPVLGLAVADLTNDGEDDLVATTSSTGSTSIISVLLNSGGTFAAAGQVATTFANPGPLIVADVDGDGIADIVTMNAAGDLDFFHGTGQGSFDAAVASQPTAGTPTAMAAADVNEDARADVIFTETNSTLAGDGGFGVMLGQTPPAYSETVTGTLVSTGVAGQKIKLSQTIKITNVSGKKVTGRPEVEVALSSDTNFSSDDFVIAIPKAGGSLNAGKSTTIHATARGLPADIPPGTYYVVVQATDPNGGISTASSLGTINIAAPEIDLTGTFKHLPATGRVGHPLLATITVTNLGNIPAAGMLPVSVYDSGDGQLDGTSTGLVGFTQRINIKPGKSVTFKLSKLMTPAAGSYFLLVVLDKNNTLGDVNISNNTFVSATEFVAS
jgi:hypothetical protein